MTVTNLQVVVTASAEVTPARKPAPVSGVDLGDVTPSTTDSTTDSTAPEKE